MERPMTMEEYRRIPDWIRMEARISKPNTRKRIDWEGLMDKYSWDEIKDFVLPYMSFSAEEWEAFGF